MTTIPNVRVPAGMRVEEDGEGGFVVVPSNEPMQHTIALRVPGSTYASLLPFVDTFPEHTLSVALRWLLDHPTVRDVMADRVRRGVR